MSGEALRIAASGKRRRAAGRPGAAVLRAKDGLAWCVVAVVALAPIPLGSARPIMWALNAAALGLIGLVYWLRVRNLVVPWRLPPSPALVMPLCCALLVFMALQILPLPAFAPLPGFTVDGRPVGVERLSIAPGATWLMMLRFLTYGLLALLVAQFAASWSRTLSILRVLLYVVGAYAAYAVIALTQLGDPLLFFEKWTYRGSATGTFVNRNSFATFLSFGLVTGVGLLAVDYARQTDLRGRFRPDTGTFVNLACIAVIAAALLATQSRMGVAAGLAGVAVVALATLRRLEFGRAAVIAGLALVCGGLVVLGVLYGGGVTERLGSLERDADVRWSLYLQVWRMIMERPWLGYGGGTFELAYPMFHELPVSPDLVWDKAHNTYLSLWAELGLIAGSIPVIIVALFAKAAMRKLDDGRTWGAAAIGLGVIAVAAIHSLIDFSLEIQANALLFVLLVGLGCAPPRRPGP